MSLAYRPEIDGLRALAVLPVILFHAGLSVFSGGYVGVDVFFVISGFLITAILARELEAGRFSLLTFYERRARRILPALFFVLLVTTIAGVVLMLPYELEALGRALVAVVFFVSNILFWTESGYFAPDAELNPLLHTWSLAVEEQYYILFPLLLWVLWRAPRVVMWAALGVLAVASLWLAQSLSTAAPSANFYLLPSRAWELLAGSLTALYLMRRAPPRGWLAEAMGGAGLCAILASIFLYTPATPFPSLWTLVPVLGTVGILLGASGATVVGRALSWGPCVGIGLISYSAYLWHQPLFAFARMLTPGDHPPQALMLALAALTLALAWGTWRFVERPFRARDGLSGRQIFRLSALGSVGVLALGLAFVSTNGLLNRVPEHQRAWVSEGDLDYAPFVYQAYIDIHEAPLSDDTPNIVLVGDSFSQDFYNAARAVGAFEGYALTGLFVPARCQLHYGLPPAVVAEHIAPGDRATCAKEGIGAEALARMRQADVVIFSANWRVWAAETFAQSLAAMDLPGRIIVLGSKAFEPDRRALLRYDSQSAPRARSQPSEKARETTRLLRETLPPAQFVDTLALLCDAQGCPIFTSEGALISYDGLHLTPAGAGFVGEKLFESGVLAPFAP